MTKTIGNPLSWLAGGTGAVLDHAASVGDTFGKAEAEAMPVPRRITVDDLRLALRRGAEDLGTFRSDVVFVCLLYPIIGAVLAALALRGDAVQLIFPVLSGFALVGPVAAVGLYEMSRRRERGKPVNWLAYLDVLQSPKFGGVVLLALLHALIFVIWVMLADLIATLTIGADTPRGLMAFAQLVLGTGAGWAMIVIGCAVGFVFATLVLAMSIVSFPLLLDRNVGVVVAVVTSVRVALLNPWPVAVWGMIVAGSLVLGAIPALLGLVIVLPLLGHATWYVYRAAVG